MKITPIDFTDPLEVFAAFDGYPFAHLLGAGARVERTLPGWGNGATVLVAFPQKTLIAQTGAVFEDGHEITKDPFIRLQEIMRERHIFSKFDGSEMCGFYSGAVGHIGYEMAAWIEPKLSLPRNPTALPDMALGFYDAALIFNCAEKTLGLFELYDGAGERLTEVSQKSRQCFQPVTAATLAPVFSSHTQIEYESNVQTCKNAILDGDIFQANLSRRLKRKVENIPPRKFFRDQMATSSAAYTALLQYATGSIISNSPERFFSVYRDDGNLKVLAEPIKGTRPRGIDPATDLFNIQELKKDVKDRAENIMIVDLVRNDLSKVCEDESVKVDNLCDVQSFTNVHHLVSQVRGLLRPGLSAVDLLVASFPCGSITGAPKMKAMQVIAALEEEGRGAYCGAIGFIDDSGSATFSVAIRTSILDTDQKELSYRSGGGITLLSDPTKEYFETVDKARDFCDISRKGLRESNPDRYEYE